MHLNFNFTAVQVLWTLTFAGLLVLMVVLLGRDRVRHFPWFTGSIVLAALRLLAARLLFGRMSEITLSTIFITMGDLSTVVGLMVVLEMALNAFSTAKRLLWIVWPPILVAMAAGLLAVWGPWPAWKTLTADSALASLRLMQLVAQKGDLLLNVLTVGLGLLVVIFGSRFKAGWRSHVQQIAIGLSTAAIAQLAVQGVWQLIALKAMPHNEAEYERILGLRDKLFNANSAVFVAVLVWWIACLWLDEPGAASETPVEIPSDVAAQDAAQETNPDETNPEPENGQ